MLSGYHREARVVGSDFSFLGGTAIALWGRTNETAEEGTGGPAAGIDGTDGNHPDLTLLEGNTAREVGIYEKQASFFFQAKAARSTVRGNVFFNGPRAGLNFNDGFAGGDEVANNLIFSTCRETGDHGPINSWDRQPYLTTTRTGAPSLVMQWRSIHHNLIIDNFSPQEDVDNDDGSAYYDTHHNVLVYGSTGLKSDYGGHDNRHHENVYVYVDVAVATWKAEMQGGHADYFYGNKVVLRKETVTMQPGVCIGPGKAVIHSNQYFTQTGKVKECEMDLAKWQELGNDINSTVAVLPTASTIISWATDVLGIGFPEPAFV